MDIQAWYCSTTHDVHTQDATPLGTFKWPLGPITRSKSKALKDKLHGLVQMFVTQAFKEFSPQVSSKSAQVTWINISTLEDQDGPPAIQAQ